MDAVLNSAQKMLVDATAQFIKHEWPIGRIRDRTDERFDASVADRHAMADLGWFSLLVPPDLGGGSLSDDPLVDCVLLGRARGAALHPANFVGTNVVAAALAAAGSTEQTSTVLSALLSGDAGAAWAGGSTGADVEPTTGVVARQTADNSGYVLQGLKAVVADAAGSDWLLVTALTDDDRPTQFILSSNTPGVRTSDLDGLDVTRRFAQIIFDNVTVDSAAVLGEWGGAADLVEYQFQVAAVLSMAEMVGAMGADFALALEYAKTRIAFGRPIGSFQGAQAPVSRHQPYAGDERRSAIRRCART